MEFSSTMQARLAVYILTVREKLGALLLASKVIGHDEKADRQLINQTFFVIASWSEGVSPEITAKELEHMLPTAWSRKKKVKI